MIRRKYAALIITFVLALYSWTAVSHGDLIEYGDFAGSTVDFLMVTEISAEPLPLYGPPTVLGDALDFIAPGFISESNLGGLDFLDGRLRFMVEAHDGYLIDSISLREFGAYFTLGDDSLALVSAIAFVVIGDDVFDGSFLFETSGDSTGPWLETLEISFEPTDKITFVMDNFLFTRADKDGAAFIDKKGVRISVHTIPEPSATIVLIGLVVGIGSCRKRRSRSDSSTSKHQLSVEGSCQ